MRTISLKRRGRRWIHALKHVNRLPEIWRCAIETRDWLAMTPAYLQMGSFAYPATLHLRNGYVIRVESFHDLATVWVVFCRREYHVPADAELVIDLGANFGAFTLAAAHAAPRAKIVSVEPFPEVFLRLQRHVELNRLSHRALCIESAVARRSGRRRMDSSGEVSQSRGLLKDSDELSTPGVPVVASTLGEIFQRAMTFADQPTIDLVKMDIEGGEHELLEQLNADRLAPVKRWQMEYHPNGPKSALFAALVSCGLKCVRDVRMGDDCGVAHFAR